MSEDTNLLLEALEAANEAIREGCENVLELAKEIELRDAAITTLRDELTNCAQTLQAVRDDRDALHQRVAELERELEEANRLIKHTQAYRTETLVLENGALRQRVAELERDAARYRILSEAWFAIDQLWDKNSERARTLDEIGNAGDIESLGAALDARIERRALAQEHKP